MRKKPTTKKHRQESGAALKRLGFFIKRRRKAQSLSQTTVADLAGVGLNFVSQIEAGKSTAQIGKVLKVLNTLGLRIVLEEGSETIIVPEVV